MAKEDYMTFNEVLDELQVSEEELQRLVSEVKLRAFRMQNTLKFKRGDVANLKRQWETNVTKVIPPVQADTKGSGETLLEMPEGKPAAGSAAKGKGAAASEQPVEEELGTQLYFEELPLGESEKPGAGGGAASPPKTTETNISLESLDAGGGDEITDTVIPTIELGGEESPSDDTTDTVIPTIELSTNDLTDDTSDTVIPTIELSSQGGSDPESTATAFPTIELGGGGVEAEKTADTGAITADMKVDETGAELAQDTQKLSLTTDTSEMDFAATKTEEEIPTFDDTAPLGIQTQQEGAAAASGQAVGFAQAEQAGAETTAVGAAAETAAAPEAGGTAEVGALAPVVTIGVAWFFVLLPTLALLLFSGVVLASAVTVVSPDFRSPDYLEKVLQMVREYILPKLG